MAQKFGGQAEAAAELMRRVRRPGLGFAACTSAGFALAPHDSLRYWTHIAYEPNRVGGISYASNQSLLGALARLGLSNPVRTWLWLALCVPVAALAVICMRGAFRANQVTSALLLNAMAGLLISPIILVTPLGLGGSRAAHLPRHHHPEPSTAAGIRGPGTSHLRNSTSRAASLRRRP